jgi:hypothetical protein
MSQKFSVELFARGPKGAWIFMPIPFDVHQVFGSRARVSVSGTINGFPFRSSIMPEGDGTHYMAVSKEMQKGAQATAGDTVQVVMAVDTAPRPVEIPADLEEAFKQDSTAKATFAALAYSHRKEFVVWINQAKRPETRANRVAKTIEKLAANLVLSR